MWDLNEKIKTIGEDFLNDMEIIQNILSGWDMVRSHQGYDYFSYSFHSNKDELILSPQQLTYLGELGKVHYTLEIDFKKYPAIQLTKQN